MVIGGGSACAWMVHTAPLPQASQSGSRVPDVATQVAMPHVEQAPVVGHGSVRAKHQVNIVPEISGRLTHIHPDLAQGKVIPKGELLFEIDPIVYDARVRQSEAEIQGLESTLARHDQEQKNLEERVANAEEMLTIERDDYATSKHLYQVEKVGTQRDLDQVHQKFLRQKDVIVELKSRLSMIPHLRQETQAQLESARSRQSQAKHDLENTRIVCPFEARVESVQAYKTQVVTAHFSIATLTDMEAFEISVGIDPRELRWLDENVRPGALQSAAGDGPVVQVRWAFQGQELTWEGRVSRFERVDEATRTARLVVEVSKVDMVATVTSGSSDLKPMLSIGMFCKTDLPAAELREALTVPRHAIYDNQWVYVFEPDSQSPDGKSGVLGRREVTMLRSMHDAVLVDYASRGGNEVCELKAGERVVVSPLVKPVVGMRIRLRDEDLAQATYELPITNYQLPRVAENFHSTPAVEVQLPVTSYELPMSSGSLVGNWQSAIGNLTSTDLFASTSPIGEQ